MQRVHVDIVRPLPQTKRGHRYILSVQCAYTKWAEALPLPNQCASTCAREIVQGWAHRYGAPDSSHSDQDHNFESKVFQQMCKILQIKKTRTTAYHLAENSQVENFNQVVKSLLKSKIEIELQQWDQHLGASLMAY